MDYKYQHNANHLVCNRILTIKDIFGCPFLIQIRR
nr:MAG TPA: hypothetical protein [Caudoviricetes sp.]